jgi:hypothetical protein
LAAAGAAATGAYLFEVPGRGPLMRSDAVLAMILGSLVIIAGPLMPH